MGFVVFLIIVIAYRLESATTNKLDKILVSFQSFCEANAKNPV